MNNYTPIFSEQNKHIGNVIGDTWRKTIKNTHMLQKPPSFANDIKALHDAEKAGAVNVVITNIDTGTVYHTTIEKIFKKGFLVNRGFGNQIGLCLKDWDTSQNPNLVPISPPITGRVLSDTEGVKPLIYHSRAVKGVVWNGRQMELFEVNNVD